MGEVALKASIASIQQVGTLMIEEARLCCWVSEDIEQLKEQFVAMEASLRQADRKRRDDVEVNTWIKQAHQLAYDVENYLDEFLLLLQKPSPGMDFIGKCRWYALHCLYANKWRMSCRIRVINRRIQNIHQLKGKFSIEPSSSTVEPTHKTDNEPRLRDPHLEDSQLVGIDRPREKLVRMLMDGGHEERRVISITGMGGLGKTTLARRVMKDKYVVSHFQHPPPVWITVSKSYSSSELFKALIRSIFANQRRDLEDLSADEQVKSLRFELEGLRYMIVLDDVWEDSAWDDLKRALPENNQQSRVIITTRRLDVAKYCSMEDSLVYKLEPLSEKDSWSLLYKTVFKSSICPPELEKISIEIVGKCGGLPLAIVLMGGVLRVKGRTVAQWDFVRRGLVSESVEEHGWLDQILWLSYEDLPDDLKPCYLYFAMFPEDYPVNRGMLTRQLVGEGFIAPCDGTVSLEEIAEKYIHDLIYRNLIQVHEKDIYGRAKVCKIHDVLHELLVSQCRKQNFLVIPREMDQGGTNHDKGSVNRLSVGKGRQVPADTSLKQVRSFFMYPANISAYPKFSRFKMLRVLNLQDAPLDAFPRCILSLYHLRYLNIRGTKIKKIPNSISRLRNLQTLDLKRTDIPKLPNGIVHCTSLRNILVHGPGGKPIDKYYAPILVRKGRSKKGATMPVQLGSLVCLQKLCFLKLNGREQVKELGKLTQLRNLAISDVTGEQMTALADSISNMNQLRSLHVTRKDQNEAVNLFSSLTKPLVRCLTICGRLQSLSQLDARAFTSLTKIVLGNSLLEEDPFQVLQHLPALTFLTVRNAYTGLELRCGPHGFRKLDYLVVNRLENLCSLIIDKGGMPLLEIMEIRKCFRLATASRGIQHLQSLKQLHLTEVPDFIQNMRSVSPVSGLEPISNFDINPMFLKLVSDVIDRNSRDVKLSCLLRKGLNGIWSHDWVKKSRYGDIFISYGPTRP